MTDSTRASSRPGFWDSRYEREPSLFGTTPSEFLRREAGRLDDEREVVELGAGEGRNLLWLAEERGCSVTAVDFSEEALRTATDRARELGVDLETIAVDVRAWTPERQWDVALVSFLQLLPPERKELYTLLRRIVRPGGWILGEWFRPAHLEGEYDRIGPSRGDRMVSLDELESAFSQDEIVHCVREDVELAHGPFLNGRAAVVRGIVRRRDDA